VEDEYRGGTGEEDETERKIKTERKMNQ